MRSLIGFVLNQRLLVLAMTMLLVGVGIWSALVLRSAWVAPLAFVLTMDAGVLAAFLIMCLTSADALSRYLLNRPIVGIAHSVSGFNNCHRHMPEMVEAVKRGVLAAGAAGAGGAAGS